MTKYFTSILLFLLSTSFIPNTSIAQLVQQEWVRRFSDTSSANFGGISMKFDGAGFVYVLLTNSTYGGGFLKYNPAGVLLVTAFYNPPGYTNGARAFDVSSSGEVYMTGISSVGSFQYIRTTKFSSAGALQWSKLFADGSSSVSDIRVDNAGNVIIVGSTGGNSLYGLTLKYNPAGDTMWVRRFNNGMSEAYINKIRTDNSNNVYATGSVGIPGRCAVLKYDSSGNLNWSRIFTIDSARSNIGQGIDLDSFGNSYVIGTQVVAFAGLNDYLLKLDGSGSPVWSRIFTGIITGQGQNDGTPIGPAVTPDGSSIYYSTASQNGMGGGSESIATLKYSSAGDSQWVQVYNGGGIPGTANMPKGIQIDKYGSPYVCGTGYFQTTGSDYVTVKYLPSGIQQWVVTYSGVVTNGVEIVGYLLIDTNMNVYVTGSSRNIGNTGYVAATVKYNQPVGIISTQNEAVREFKLFQNYPNPFNPTSIINYEVPRLGRIKLSIFNVVGQEVKLLVDNNQEPGTYSIAVNMANSPSGVYFYRMSADGNLIDTKKLMLVK